MRWLVFMVALTACAPSGPPAALVQVTAIPAQAVTLEARFDLAGHAAMHPQDWMAPTTGFRDSESFVVVLPSGATGALSIQLAALDSSGCTLAAGDATAMIDSTNTLSIPLVVDARSGCPLTVAVTGDGEVDAGGQSCAGQCSWMVARQTSLSVAATPQSGSVFVKWGGACEGDADCSLSIDRPTRLDASFGRSGLIFAESFSAVTGCSGQGIAVDQSGMIALLGRIGYGAASTTGTFGDITVTTAGNSDVLVAGLDPAGAVRWAEVFGCSEDDWATTGVFDDQGNLYVAGFFGGDCTFGGTSLPGDASDGLVLKLSPEGAVLWAQRVGSPSDKDQLTGVVLFQGQLYVTGQAPPSSYVQQLDPSTGALGWRVDLTGDSNDMIILSTLTATGNSLVAGGHFSGTRDFLGQSKTSTGSTDCFLLALSPSGTRQWLSTFGGTDIDYLDTVAPGVSGELLASGEFYGTAKFGNTMLTAKAGSDAFLLRASASDGSVVQTIQIGAAGLNQGIAIAATPTGGGMTTGWYNFQPEAIADVYFARFDQSLNISDFQTLGANAQWNAPGGVAFAHGSFVTSGVFQQTIHFGDVALTSQGADTNCYVAKWSP